MQLPTCSNLRIRTARDAEVVFHAVALGVLPMVTRRLDSEERMALSTGCVYVWEERTSNVSDSLDHGIERFTEGRSWGPSRARDDFLFYQEKDTAPKSMMVERTRALRYQEDPVGSYTMRPRRQGERMIKQTYSVYITGHAGTKKWHLNAYWTQETLDQLATVDDIPHLRSLPVPAGLYICARTNRMRDGSNAGSTIAGRRSSPTAPAHLPYALSPHSPSPSPTSQTWSPTSRSTLLSSSSPVTTLSPTTPPFSFSSSSASSSNGGSPVFPPHVVGRCGPGESKGLIMLAPLEVLNGCQQHRPRRDAADERALRSLDRRWR